MVGNISVFTVYGHSNVLKEGIFRSGRNGSVGVHKTSGNLVVDGSLFNVRG